MNFSDITNKEIEYLLQKEERSKIIKSLIFLILKLR